MRLRTICAWAMAACGGQAAAAAVRPPVATVSHIAVYSTDAAKTDRFYVHDLGGVRRPDPETPKGVRYYFNPVQFVEVLPLPAGDHSIDRLDHIALNTPDAEAMRVYLASKGIATPAHVQRGGDGGQWFDVIDPEGLTVQFVQPPVAPAAVVTNPLSSHMIHVGFIVHDRAREDGFYRGVLGFRPYWYGGMSDAKPTWVSLQTPDGHDWLEYMIVGEPEGHGVPADMSQQTLGVLNHFSLGIANAEAAYTTLWTGDRLQGQPEVPKIGRDAKWQLNLIDPDGTRAELMEFHAIGKPCCSPFTAQDPQK